MHGSSIKLTVKLLGLALCSLSLLACGGRATLSDASGKASRRVWMTQLESQPAKRLSTLSAADAKIALDRHYGKGKGRSISSGGISSGGYGGGRGGQLTPSTTDISDGNPDGRKITLQ